jgi:hypothetical protein
MHTMMSGRPWCTGSSGIVAIAVAFAGPALACGSSGPSSGTGGLDDSGAGIDGGGGAPSDGAPSSDRTAMGSDGDASSPLDSGNGDATVEGGACALPPPAADAADCNGATLAGSPVASTCSGAEPPAATGGAIEDGVYVLDSVVYYGTCPTAATMTQATWYVCGSQWATAQGFGTLEQLAATVVRGGTSLTATLTCGGSSTVTWQYSASPGQLALAIGTASTGNVRIETYARQ